MEAVRTSETSIYSDTTRRNIRTRRREKLKSQVIITVLYTLIFTSLSPRQDKKTWTATSSNVICSQLPRVCNFDLLALLPNIFTV
jgi:hypothetical protein